MDAHAFELRDVQEQGEPLAELLGVGNHHRVTPFGYCRAPLHLPPPATPADVPPGGFERIAKLYAIDGKLAQRIGIMLYFSGMLSSYCASTLYHAWPAGKVWKEKLRRIDHAAIYWHIAGSYSPFTLIALREQDFWGWGLFGFVWLCAVAGTVMSLNRLKEHSNLETVCFIAMGLTILVALDPLLKTTSMETILWIIAEGVCFITGAVFYSWHQRKFMHSVFHFFVLGGSICHIMAVWHLLAPMMS